MAVGNMPRRPVSVLPAQVAPEAAPPPRRPDLPDRTNRHCHPALIDQRNPTVFNGFFALDGERAKTG
jgi:hypothetical protein